MLPVLSIWPLPNWAGTNDNEANRAGMGPRQFPIAGTGRLPFFEASKGCYELPAVGDRIG